MRKKARKTISLKKLATGRRGILIKEQGKIDRYNEAMAKAKEYVNSTLSSPSQN